MKAFTMGLLVLLGLAGVVTYSYLKPAPEASAPIQSVAPEQATPSATGRVFEFVPEETEARFVIDEVLQGAPKTVVGTTDQVAGQIVLNPSDPDTARVGPILINARTFVTDSEQRNRAIRNRILQTEQHEYITFTPTELVGLPDDANPGESVPLQVVGELTIGGTTREVTFDATVTPESPDRLAGNASTTIRYADWGIAIPRVPAVTGVSETVRLELDFVAAAA